MGGKSYRYEDDWEATVSGKVNEEEHQSFESWYSYRAEVCHCYLARHIVQKRHQRASAGASIASPQLAPLPASFASHARLLNAI